MEEKIKRINRIFKRSKGLSALLFCSYKNQEIIPQVNEKIISGANRDGLNVDFLYYQYKLNKDCYGLASLTVSLDKLKEKKEVDAIIFPNLDQACKDLGNKKTYLFLNNMREELIEQKKSLLLWFPLIEVGKVIQYAPDLWSRRETGLIEF